MVIRMRHTKSHTKNRRSHHALKKIDLIKCSNCDALKKHHVVCSTCGFYKGKQVLDVVKKIEKKQERMKAKKASE